MRLQMKRGINNCIVMNDSYSNDIHSLKTALNFVKQQSHNNKKTIILSDMPGEISGKAWGADGVAKEFEIVEADFNFWQF